MKTRLYCIYLFLIFSVSKLTAQQDGSIDLNFNKPIYLDPPAYNGFSGDNLKVVYSTIILRNGKLLAYGDFDEYMKTRVSKLALLNPNGILDSSFNVGSGPDHIISTHYSNMICEQSDGKILVVGDFHSFNGVKANAIVRLNTDGSVDKSFHAGIGEGGGIYCVKLQHDGKILIAGAIAMPDDVVQIGIIRLNTDGSIDNSFSTGTGFSYINAYGVNEYYGVYSIETQEDKILVGGYFNRFNNIVKNSLVRLNADGSLDNSFNVNVDLTNGRPIKIVYQPGTGFIYLGGQISYKEGVVVNKVIRLDSNGNVDETYNFPDIKDIFDFNFMPDGKLLLGGNFIYKDCWDMARFNVDGSCDTNFHFKSFSGYNHPAVFSISVSDAGEFYTSGYFDWINHESVLKGCIAKVLNTGQTDLSFNPVLGVATCYSSSSLGIDSDTILVFNSIDWIEGVKTWGLYYNERPNNGYVKIASSGSLLYANTKPVNLRANLQLSLSSDGKYICSQYYTGKLNPDLTLDSTYLDMSVLVSNFNVESRAHLEQKDGKIIIAGDFHTLPPYYAKRRRIIRVNADGTNDDSFDPHAGFNITTGAETDGHHVNTMQFLSDSSFLAGGNFSDFSGNSVSNIVLINSDGSYNPAFNSGTAFNAEVKCLLVQKDFKVMVCGYFTEYDGNFSNYIIRLNQNGSVDQTFTSPFSKSDEFSRISKVIIQADGKYLVAGTLNGNPRLIRLNINGTIDNTFFNDHVFVPDDNYGTEYHDKIQNINILSDNKILVQGNFLKIDNVQRRGIALLNNTLYWNGITDLPTNTIAISIYPNPVSNVLSINTTQIVLKTELFEMSGRLLRTVAGPTKNLDVSNLKNGVYILKVYTGNENQIFKVVKK